MNKDTSIIEIKGIGEKLQKLFSKQNIKTVGELVSHYPIDYETYQEPMHIEDVDNGMLCAIRGRIKGIPTLKKIRNLTILNVLLTSNGTEIKLTYFNMPFLKNVFKPNVEFIFRGNIQKNGLLISMEQPKYYKEEEYKKLMEFIQPRYSLTKGLTNTIIQKSMKQALSLCDFEEEFYSKEFLTKYQLMDVYNAHCNMHFPSSFDDILPARKRLVFDEFFHFMLVIRKNKNLFDKLENNFPLIETSETKHFLEKIPFQLTNAQKKVWAEICHDINSPYCMNRLIQGDVGSGKTILAILALLSAVSNGFQGAMMAPTEVLATQHFESIIQFQLNFHLPFQPVLLVGSMSTKQKKDAYAKIASGEANLIIGTHAVIQEKVNFHSLALVVTDEQHRFGVRQRDALVQKGLNPHVLVMSATPIPRTLAIILYGDLDISIIDELPADRKPIKNCVVNTSYRPTAYKFIESEVKNGRQVYIICPMVEPGEMEELENVIDYTQKMKAVLPEFIQIEYLHGKMKPADKKRIMEEFHHKKIDVLVSTTVIEVGINVPNATIMMVENSERFGLAQLHQLRGRVGRGEHQSYCIFIYTKDQKETKERLEILNHSNDGFYIASEDLKLRGPGDLFGIRQSGELLFKVGDIYADADVLKMASEAVDLLLKEDPDLTSEQNKNLRLHYSNSSNMVDFHII